MRPAGGFGVAGGPDRGDARVEFEGLGVVFVGAVAKTLVNVVIPRGNGPGFDTPNTGERLPATSVSAAANIVNVSPELIACAPNRAVLKSGMGTSRIAYHRSGRGTALMIWIAPPPGPLTSCCTRSP